MGDVLWKNSLTLLLDECDEQVDKSLPASSSQHTIAPADPARAVEPHQKAIDLGSIESVFRLARLLKFGSEGVESTSHSNGKQHNGYE